MEHPENNPEYAGLTVNSGVGPVSIVNPYLKRGRYARRQFTADDYVEGILRGDVTILGQAVTLVESTNPVPDYCAGGHREVSALFRKECAHRYQRRAGGW